MDRRPNTAIHTECSLVDFVLCINREWIENKQLLRENKELQQWTASQRRAVQNSSANALKQGFFIVMDDTYLRR